MAFQVPSNIIRPSVRLLASWSWTRDRLDRKPYGHCIILMRDHVVSIEALVEGKALGTEVAGHWFGLLSLLFPIVVGREKIPLTVGL